MIADPAKPLRLTRRDLFRVGIGAGGALAAGLSSSCAWSPAPCREVAPNPFTRGGRPLLVAVQGEDLDAMLQAGIEALGGLDRLLSFGQEAVFRANYVARQPYPVTTAPEFIAAVGRQLKTCGFRRRTLFDSHGSALVTASAPDAIMRGLGVHEQLGKEGIEVVSRDFLDAGEFRPVRNAAWRISSPVGLHRMLHEAGVVISLPVVKRHGAARFTCALKMHFGSVAMADRIITHKKGMRGDSEFFDERLVNFADAVKPQLNIVDARAILTRSGPTLSAGGRVVRDVNRIIFCGDMVATDAYCARLLAEHDETFSLDMVERQLKIAGALKIGTADLDAVRIVEIKL
jgi:uncharacterized protein (DUF362 family)